MTWVSGAKCLADIRLLSGCDSGESGGKERGWGWIGGRSYGERGKRGKREEGWCWYQWNDLVLERGEGEEQRGMERKEVLENIARMRLQCLA